MAPRGFLWPLDSFRLNQSASAKQKINFLLDDKSFVAKAVPEFAWAVETRHTLWEVRVSFLLAEQAANLRKNLVEIKLKRL